MSNSSTRVVSEQRGNVLLLTLDGVETRNAIGPDVYPVLQAHIVNAETDPEIGAIVLTGANGFFSSGGNVNALKASGASTLAAATGNTDKLNALILSIAQSSMPIIAAVEGGAAGAGFSLCLACDMIVAGEDARFTAAYVRVGLSPDGGATHFLTRALPRQLVNEICMLGRPVPALRLHAAGLINSCYPAGRALEASLDLASEIAAGPPNAMRNIKEIVRIAGSSDLPAQLAIEARAINRARFGEEAAEGLSAFIEKRKANFQR